MSNQYEASNLGFSRIKDTVYDSKIMEGLVRLGVLPEGYRAIHAVLDVSKMTVEEDGVSIAGQITDGECGIFRDVFTGERVLIHTSKQVITCQLSVVDDLAGTSGDFKVGVGHLGQSIDFELTTDTITNVNNKGDKLSSHGVYIELDDDNEARYLKGQVVGTDLTEGVVQLLLVIV
jgi:hypothetical protein